jgi:hypothetical protein
MSKTGPLRATKTRASKVKSPNRTKPETAADVEDLNAAALAAVAEVSRALILGRSYRPGTISTIIIGRGPGAPGTEKRRWVGTWPKRAAATMAAANAAGVSVAMLATTAACSETSIRNAVKSGDLPAIRIGRRLRVPHAAARKFVKTHRARGA